jgi:hypothetical protein
MGAVGTVVVGIVTLTVVPGPVPPELMAATVNL